MDIITKDRQAQRFQLTINNPVDHGFSHEEIKNTLINHFKTVSYFCMVDEQGTCYHTHVFVCFNSRVRVSMIKKHFPSAHYEITKGTVKDNIDYIQKGGKWENDVKHGTQIEGTFEEYGTRPSESKGRDADMAELYEMVLCGMTNAEIIAINQDYIMHLSRIDQLRTTILTDKYRDCRRLDLRVVYVYGATGTGKTRDILDEHGDSNVYRVTDYQHPFDQYANQEIIMFDEFRDSLRIQDMLNYCDIYPISLPSRYANKFACYNKVYIVSNWALENQYAYLHHNDKESWDAFLRRIHKVKVYTDTGIRVFDSVAEYMAKKHELREPTAEEKQVIKDNFETDNSKENHANQKKEES